jgi:hypothetical protein
VDFDVGKLAREKKIKGDWFGAFEMNLYGGPRMVAQHTLNGEPIR